MRYALPSGLTLERFEYWRFMRVRHDAGDVNTSPVTYISLKSPIFQEEFEWCGEGCNGLGTATTDIVPENHIASPQYQNLRHVYFGADCVGSGSCGTRSGETASMQMAGLDAVVRDDSAPIATQVTGPVTEPGAHSGNEAVDFQSRDVGGGVYRVEIALRPARSAEYKVATDVVVDSNDGRCVELDYRTDTDREFGFRQPCRLSAAASATLDTTVVPDGEYDLRVMLEDAAGNATKVYESSSFKIDNVPGAGGGGPAGSGSAPGGGDAGGGAGAAPGEPNGANASERARLTLSGARVRSVRFGRKAQTTLTLRDESGRPISRAAVAVLQRMAVPGGAWVPARAPLVTDGDGRVRYVIQPGYSRTLRFVYRARVGDAQPAAGRDLTVRVRSKTSFRTNRSFLRNGQTVRFLGRLQSRPVPRAGVVIDLQARVGHRWQTFNTVRTKSDGRWHASYRFRSTTGLQTYVFRARVRGDTGFPYTPSISKRTSVRVRG
jgi:hypothetical protein